MKMKVVYLRVSSDEQREKQTIAGQRSEVLKACELRGVKIDKVYEDDGVSGTIPLGKRPYGSQLLEDALADRIAEVYIWKFDRLGRNLRDFLNLFDRLDKLGIHVESIMQSVPKGPAGRAMMQMLGAFAELDRANIMENTWRGLAAKAATGGWNGGHAPFGYRADGEKRQARLVIDEDRAKIVRYLFEQVAAGKSLQSLADYLNQNDVPTSRQNPSSVWRPSSIKCIIRNRIYTGTTHWGLRQWSKEEVESGEIIKHLKMTPERVIIAACDSIVIEELFRRANAVLATNLKEAMAHAKLNNEYLLRSRITCSSCGCNYLGRGRYYSCTGRHQAARRYGKNKSGEPKQRCMSPIIRRDDIEGRVWSLCEAYIWNPDQLSLDLAEQRAKGGEPLKKLQGELVEVEQVLAKQAIKRQRAQDSLTDGIFDRAEYNRQVMRINATTEPNQRRREELRAAIRGAQEEARGEQEARSFLETLRDAQSAKGEYDSTERRRIVESLVGSVTVLPNGECRIDLRFHFEGSDWRAEGRRRVAAMQGCVMGSDPLAGAEALRVALGATPKHWNMRTSTASFIET